MERTELVKDVLEIPEDFDLSELNCLDGGWPISMQIEDWVYISLICDRADLFRPHEDSETVEWFKEKVREATIKAYNIRANRNNYAKEMVEKGLWPDHS
jgi:hypothetical protein